MTFRKREPLTEKRRRSDERYREWMNSSEYKAIIKKLEELPPIAACLREYAGSNIKSQLRVKLWQQVEGTCKWCGKLTFLLKPSEKFHHGKVERGGRDPNLIATVDHLFSKYHPEKDSAAQDFVLACALCNNTRQHEEAMRYVGLDELRKRSGRLPLDPSWPFPQPRRPRA